MNIPLFYSEQDILREELRSLEMVKAKMGERIKELENEVRELKEKLEARSEDDQVFIIEFLLVCLVVRLILVNVLRGRIRHR